MKLRSITEDEYAGLEDADEFMDEPEWQQDNLGPVIAGPYEFMAHTLYRRESREMDTVVLLVNGKDFDHIRDETNLNKIKTTILAEYPEYQQKFFDNPFYAKLRFGLADCLRDVIQDLCFNSGNVETQIPNLGLFQ